MFKVFWHWALKPLPTLFSHRALLFSLVGVQTWWKTNMKRNSEISEVKDLFLTALQIHDGRFTIAMIKILLVKLPYGYSCLSCKTALTPCFWKRLWDFSRKQTPYHTLTGFSGSCKSWFWTCCIMNSLEKTLLPPQHVPTVWLCFGAHKFIFKKQSREWLTLVICCVNWGMNYYLWWHSC